MLAAVCRRRGTGVVSGGGGRGDVVPTMDDDEASAAPAPPLLGSTRGGIALLLFAGLFATYTLRSNMSQAIMPIGEQYGYGNEERGWIHSAFFVGYLLTGMWGGHLATTHGGWVVMLAGVGGASAFTLACVPAASSLRALLLCRVGVGLCQGVIYPSVHSLLARWAPRQEKATLVGAVWSGGFLGPAVTVYAAGALIASTVAMPGGGAPLQTGWPSVFYASAAAGAAWCAAWAALGASGPEAHARITPAERAFIAAGQDAAAGGGGGGPVPWGRIVRNPAVLALCASHTCHNSQLYMLLSWMPTYLREQVGLDLASAGAAAVLPFLACFAASAVAGVAGDAALKRGASASLVRKTAMTVSEVLPALAMLALGRTSSPGAAVAALTVALGLSGACSAGFAANGLDIAPRYAGVVFGLSNTLATLPGIVSPALVGALVAAPHNDRAHWNVAFTLSAAVSLVG